VKPIVRGVGTQCAFLKNVVVLNAAPARYVCCRGSNPQIYSLTVVEFEFVLESWWSRVVYCYNAQRSLFRARPDAVNDENLIHDDFRTPILTSRCRHMCNDYGFNDYSNA